MKKKLKQNRWTVPSPWRQSGGWERTYGEKDLWNRCVLSLEQKRVGEIDGESGDDGTGEHRWVEWEEHEGND